MYCDNCGCTLEEGVKVCPVCGKVFADANSGNNFEEDTSVLKANNMEEGTSPLASDNGEGGTEVLYSDENGEAGTTVLNDNVSGPGRAPASPQMRANGMPPYNQNGMSPLNPNRMQQMNQNGMPPYNSNTVSRDNKQEPSKNKSEKDKPAKKSKKTKKKGKAGKTALIIVLIVVVLLIAAAAILIVPRVLNYNKAEDALGEGNIEEAMELYDKATPYKDSNDMINGGAYNTYAEDLFENEEYMEAAEYYKKADELGYYGEEESGETLCYYNYAEQLYMAGEYEDAITYYEKASGLNDSGEKIKACNYQIGCSLLEANDYAGAIEAFEAAGEYEDASEKIKTCYYNEAEDKYAAGEYEEAQSLYLKAEAEDSQEKSNECLYLLANQYVEAGNYEEAISAYEQIDAEYMDCTDDIDNAYIAWGDALVEEKDYITAIETYSLVVNGDVKKKIKKAKSGYIEDHFTISDETTMTYLCELKYEGYKSASKDYEKLVGWEVESFVNYSETNLKNKKESVKASKDIYIHTTFTNDNDLSLNLKAYIVYSDGSKSNELTFSGVNSGDAAWLSISASTAPAGDTTVYIYDTDSGSLIEKYTFSISEN